MRKFFTSFICLLITLPGISQTENKISGKSTSKQISFKKNVNNNTVRLLPDLQVANQEFIDPNQNNIIDADENSVIKFLLKNTGEGEALEVNVKVSLQNDQIQGLEFTRSLNLGTVYPTQNKEVSIPLTGSIDLKSSTAKFKILITEKNGLDASPFEMEIQTKEFCKPEIVVADAVFSTEGGGKIKLNSPINLKVLIQNIGTGEAKDVKTEFVLENSDCLALGENMYNIGALKPGELKELNFEFTATRRYSFDKIPVLVALSESYGKYAERKSVSVGLEENLILNTAVVIKGTETGNAIIEKASLTADVDKNIPANTVKYPNRLALIFGNEDYSSQQRNLNSEANVKYARNDAKIFSEYVKQTMGVKEGNAFFLTDATAGEMLQNIDVVCKLASKMGPDAEIIFFYAGHGFPDENTKIPYLIPVDVSGTNLNAGIKLSDIYKKLGDSGSRKVTIFLDACFSGGGRESGLMAARGVKVKPRDESLSGNVIVFTASSGEQSALPYDEKQHGMFTYFLLKKLQETSGNITYSELGDYISREVSIESLRVNKKEQDPVINVSPAVGDTWKNWKINQ